MAECIASMRAKIVGSPIRHANFAEVIEKKALCTAVSANLRLNFETDL